jgi:hypothetical protein
MKVSGQVNAPAALPPEKEPLLLLDRRLGGSQSRSRRCREVKNILPLPGIDPHSSSVSRRYTNWIKYKYKFNMKY